MLFEDRSRKLRLLLARTKQELRAVKELARQLGIENANLKEELNKLKKTNPKATKAKKASPRKKAEKKSKELPPVTQESFDDDKS